jgi:DNA-binding HxlR family transcriptional regulator
MQDKPAPLTSDASVWEQVLPILGSRYVKQTDTDKLEKFKRLIVTAAEGGKDASGPVREVLALLGDRWSTLLLQLAHFGPLRFSTLQRIIAVLQDSGISRRMLALKLRALERDGLVLRTVTPSVPPRVEYELTQMGEDLWIIAAHLVDWLEDHSARIEAARTAFEHQEEAEPADDDEE